MSRIRADQLVNRVGSGGPKFPHGVADGFSVSGIITATSFRGDGSQLTGIDASSLKDGSNVKVQAVSGGANVTGNVAATGNVSAVDGTFSGNLTVQGTTTTIDTAVTAVDSLAVDGSITALGNIGIGTTNAVVKLDIVDSGSPNIALRGSSYPSIKYSALDGTTDAEIYYGISGNDLVLNNVNAGPIILKTDDVERLRITSGGDILPGADNTQDLGSSAKRFANIYTGDLNLSNEGSTNDVDGTWGNYTIQEGEDDLFLINRRTGKKYKFNLTEVD